MKSLIALVELTVICAFCVSLAGCSRSWHRQRADQRAYPLIKSRQIDARWDIPDRCVEPDPRSRMADLNCADCGPKPCDDPAADQFTRCPNAKCNHCYYDQIETDPTIDDLHWMSYLPRTAEGKIKLDEESVAEIALLHSREFQTQVEQVYLSGLSLSGQRFEFDTQWFGSNDFGFTAFSDAPNALRTVGQSNQVGLIRSLAAGGQLATTLANSFVWELGSNQFNAANGSLVIALTQPLLRGAFRHVRLNSLTQAERNLLYDVRDFARFRRQFYFSTVSSYLSLLTQIQSLRNQRTNLESLQLSLDEHNELLARELVSQIQVDQVFQNVQSGRINLLAAEQSLQDSFDAFKFQLGLPPWVELELDESLLEQFTLVDSKLEQLQADAQTLYERLTQTLPPEVPKRQELVEIYDAMIEIQNEAIKLMPTLTGEVAEWQEDLKQVDLERVDREQRLDIEQQLRLAERVDQLATDLEADLEADLKMVKKWDVDDPVENRQLSDLFFTVDNSEGIGSQADGPQDGTTEPERKLTNEQKLIESWSQLTRMLGKRLRERLANMYISQTQTRLFFIEIPPFDISQDQAVQLALDNRLDLMNARARTMDAFRNVEVAADALESDLTVSASATLGTDNDNAFRFDSDANLYNVGVQFDGPLNRFNEGNNYRASQIAYQVARRNLMATEDSVTNQIRSDLRQLKISQLNFQIGRQQLLTAIRQVDEAQIQLRTANGGDSSPTQDLLNALSGLLAAKNGLIGSRISYENARINLSVDLELLYLDEDGRWINRDFNPNDLSDLQLGTDEELAESADVGNGDATDETGEDESGLDDAEKGQPGGAANPGDSPKVTQTEQAKLKTGQEAVEQPPFESETLNAPE